MKISLCASDIQKDKHAEFIRDLHKNFDLVSCDSQSDAPIILLGGDGSLNFLLNQTTASKQKIIYFPTGTANDFARSLKLPTTLPHISKVESIIRQDLRISIPVMSCNDRKFINVASVGAPARVTQSGSDMLKKVMGKISYYIAGIEELFNPNGFELTYQIDNSAEATITSRGFLVSQGLYAGGGVKVSTSYTPNFGEFFNFVTLDSIDLTTSLSSILELQKEICEPSPETISSFGRTLKITSSEQIPAKLDGEEFEAKEFTFKKESRFIDFYLH